MPDINFDCELPPVVEAIRQGWLSVCRNTAIIAAVFSAVAAQLLVLFRQEKWENTEHHALIGLAIVSYGALIFNASTAISSLILIDKLGNIPISASKDTELLKRVHSGERGVKRTTTASALYLLKRYGAGWSWTWVMWHWFISLLAGVLCLMAQVLLHVFLREPRGVKIALSCFVAFAILPLSLFLPFSSLSKR